jgi:hypothetical protein
VEVRGLIHVMAAFIPDDPHLTQMTRGWMGHKATVNVLEKINIYKTSKKN